MAWDLEVVVSDFLAGERAVPLRCSVLLESSSLGLDVASDNPSCLVIPLKSSLVSVESLSTSFSGRWGVARAADADGVGRPLAAEEASALPLI